MALLLTLLPLLMAALTLAVPSNRWRPWLLPVGAAAQLAVVLPLTLASEGEPPVTALEGWLHLDALGKVFLLFLSVFFFLCALYVPGYLAERWEKPNRIFCANLFIALAMM